MVKRTRLRTKWAKKLLRSKHFILLTDKESVIYFKGVDPDDFDDVLMLTAQEAALSDFRDRINRMIKEHKRVKKEVFNVSAVDTSKANFKKRKAV